MSVVQVVCRGYGISAPSMTAVMRIILQDSIVRMDQVQGRLLALCMQAVPQHNVMHM